jgi:FKBP-type peptidyl-prolyl cis-trans isomerase SlyD
VNPVPVTRDTVVSLRIEMHDAHGTLLEAPSDPVTYLHGGHGGLLDALEHALEGRLAGESVQLQLEPEDAFGEYDAQLLRVEPAERYGEGIAVGMQIEEDGEFYSVTDVAAGKVVLDANHPLAGMALRFSLEIMTVRPARGEEIERGVALP